VSSAAPLARWSGAGPAVADPAVAAVRSSPPPAVPPQEPSPGSPAGPLPGPPPGPTGHGKMVGNGGTCGHGDRSCGGDEDDSGGGDADGCDGGARMSQPLPKPPNGENAAVAWVMIWNQRLRFSAVTGSAATAAHCSCHKSRYRRANVSRFGMSVSFGSAMTSVYVLRCTLEQAVVLLCSAGVADFPRRCPRALARAMLHRVILAS
jgi:hypothetical protein